MALIASDIPGLDRDKFGFLFHFLTFQLLDIYIYIYIYNDKLVVPISLKRASFFLLFLHILSSIPSRTLKLIS